MRQAHRCLVEKWANWEANKVNSTLKRNGLVYLLIIVAVAALFYSVSQSTERPAEKELTEIASLVDSGKVSKILVSGNQLQVQTTDSKDPIISQKEDGVNLTTSLLKLGVASEALSKVELKIAQPNDIGGWFTVIGTLLPLLLIGGLFMMIMRQAQGSNSQAMSFGKSKARVFTGDKPTVTFADVAGAEESKQELAGNCRVSQGAAEVRLARRAHPQGCAAGRPARHRQDADGQGHFW